jgi:hypothetical protein
LRAFRRRLLRMDILISTVQRLLLPGGYVP